MNFDIYRGKRVLVTGHTGFKGSWLAIWLHQLGAKVYGYSLPPPTKPSNYALAGVKALLAGEVIGDVCDRKRLAAAVRRWKPDIVFHLAAQPLVRLSYQEPYATFEANVLGTASVLDAVRAGDAGGGRGAPALPALGASCRAGVGGKTAVVCITTDKCYENKEQAKGYRETDPFGGYDPYSASKGAAEILIASYRRSFGMNLASVRAGNVIGGGDWAKDRIIPDMVKALKKGQKPGVRNPKAVRPWQHVLEPLSGYLALGAKMLAEPCSATWCSGWNFGPERTGEDDVGHVADLVARAWGDGAAWEFTGDPKAVHEANLLRLDIAKAKKTLGWKPRWSLEDAIAHTIGWYKRATRKNARALCLADIGAYEGVRS